MTLQSHLLNHGVVIDDGKVRVVVDVANKEVRLFSHYTDEKGNPKLRTEKVMEFENFLRMMSTMYFKGETK
jgi:acylphosphatase